MTLDSVASATKIGTRLLQALEDQQFERLPGGIFIILLNFLMGLSYKTRLDIDGDLK